MANKAAVVNRAVQGAQSVATAKWVLNDGDVGLPISLTDWADRSVQVDGTFGGGTVTVEGSNDGTNWFTLRDPQGTSLSFTSAGLKQIMETTLFMRANLTSGTTVTVNITVCARMGAPRSWS
jgi:hypothetical protein